MIRQFFLWSVVFSLIVGFVSPVLSQDTGEEPTLMGASTMVLMEHTDSDSRFGQAFLIWDDSESSLSVCTISHVIKGINEIESYFSSFYHPQYDLYPFLLVQGDFFQEIPSENTTKDEVVCWPLQQEDADNLPPQLIPSLLADSQPQIGDLFMIPDWETQQWSLVEVTEVTETEIVAQVTFGPQICRGQSGAPFIMAWANVNEFGWLGVEGVAPIVTAVVSQVGVTAGKDDHCGWLVRGTRITQPSLEGARDFLHCLTNESDCPKEN